MKELTRTVSKEISVQEIIREKAGVVGCWMDVSREAIHTAVHKIDDRSLVTLFFYGRRYAGFEEDLCLQ